MTPQPQLVATPRWMRRAVLAVVVLSVIAGLLSAAEAVGLGSLDEHRNRIAADAERFSFLGDPALFAAANDAQMSALESMRTWRSLLLGALAVACGVAFAAALRLLRPDGLPRESVRRLLVTSLVVASILRTIDGAQWAVVAQRSMRAAVAHLRAIDPASGVPLPESILQPLTLAGVLVHTALVAGSFLLLAQYFRSEKVKQLVALQDRQIER